jgi:hypothetical protein
MSEVYAARSVAKKHIVEQCENCNLKKNSNGLYNHDDIVKVQETIEGKLNEVFLDHDSSLGMIKLLDSSDNEINMVTTNQMISADNVINKAKKEALAATIAAKKKDKSADDVEPTITKREDAKREAERQNITNQTIVGTKEGVIEVLKRLVGGDILDTVTKTADASRDKSIDEYKLHDVFQLAYDNAVRPEVDDVLEMLCEMYQYDFDFRKPIKHSMAQLKTMATRLKPFGINPAEPELTLILLANIHHAKEQDWGQEFRAAMSAIRKKYNYDHVHDATSMAFILKELAGADELRTMKLAPAPNASKANAVSKYKSILQNANDSWDGASSYTDSSSYDYKKDGFDSSQEECLRVADRHHRDKKRSGKSSKSSKKSIDLSSSDSSSEEERKPKKKAAEVATCKYCKQYGKPQHPKRFSTKECMWNKKAVCFRFSDVCKQMNLKYIKGHEFEKGKKDEWPKHKAKEPKEDKKEDKDD